jgi:hypothetical protein
LGFGARVRVYGLGFGVWSSGLRVYDFRFLEFRVKG